MGPSGSDCLPWRIQSVIASTSLSLSSGDLLLIGSELSLSNLPGASSTSMRGETPFDLIQFKTLSMSLARSSGLCFFFGGSIWSTFWNSLVGPSGSDGLPWRIQSVIASTSLSLSSGDLLLIGSELSLSNLPGASSTSMRGETPFDLIQFKTLSMSLARSSGLCFFFGGSIWSILWNSLVALPGSPSDFPLRTHCVMLSTSFCLSSGDRTQTGAMGTLLNWLGL